MLLQLRSMAKKANKAEKVKNQKGGHKMWTEVSELGELIRAGNTSWEDLNLDDIDVRLKWSGLFHRKKRTPGKFMMRLKVGPCPWIPSQAWLLSWLQVTAEDWNGSHTYCWRASVAGCTTQLVNRPQSSCQAVGIGADAALDVPNQVPNGELNAKQLRFLGDQIAHLEGGCGDITTRANVQLRGMTLGEADKIFEVWRQRTF